MKTEDQSRLHLDQVRSLPEFAKLRDQQQIFVLKYLASGLTTGNYDAVGACKTAYPACARPKIFSYQLLNNRKIRRILDLHFRRSQLDTLVEDIRRLIKRSRKRDRTWEKIAVALEKIAGKAS